MRRLRLAVVALLAFVLFWLDALRWTPRAFTLRAGDLPPSRA